MTQAQLYQRPKYYDIAFRDRQPFGADTIETCFRDHAVFPVRRILEPGCGTGRMLLPLAVRNYNVIGYDLSSYMVCYTESRIRENGLADRATVVQANMRTARFPRTFDSAINLDDTLRYLLTDDEMLVHFRNTARTLRPGGVYLVCVSSAWDDPHSDKWDPRWTVFEGDVHIRAKWDIEAQDWKRKLSYEVCRLEIDDNGRRDVIEDKHIMRLLLLEDFVGLIRDSGCFELEAVYDQYYHRVSTTEHISGEMDELMYVLKVL